MIVVDIVIGILIVAMVWAICAAASFFDNLKVKTYDPEKKCWVEKTTEIEPKLDYNGKVVWRCGDCGSVIFSPVGTDSDENNMNYYKYCTHCGKPIKWTTPPYEHERKKVFMFDRGLY